MTSERGRYVTDLYRLADRKKRFSCIYGDPPWEFANSASRGAALRHYPTMSMDKLARLPVGELAAEDSHLHLWTTATHVAEALELMAVWGFTYKTNFVWVKPQMGLGNYWRTAHEHLLFGVRGRCQFRHHGKRSWILHARTRIHSEKPEAVRRLIETVSPGPYLELFGRREVPGWTVFGNQVIDAADGVVRIEDGLPERRTRRAA